MMYGINNNTCLNQHVTWAHLPQSFRERSRAVQLRHAAKFVNGMADSAVVQGQSILNPPNLRTPANRTVTDVSFSHQGQLRTRVVDGMSLGSVGSPQPPALANALGDPQHGTRAQMILRTAEHQHHTPTRPTTYERSASRTPMDGNGISAYAEDQKTCIRGPIRRHTEQITPTV